MLAAVERVIIRGAGASIDRKPWGVCSLIERPRGHGTRQKALQLKHVTPIQGEFGHALMVHRLADGA
jgi:hypothetical protein